MPRRDVDNQVSYTPLITGRKVVANSFDVPAVYKRRLRLYNVKRRLDKLMQAVTVDTCL